MSIEKIAKYLAGCGIASRRKSEEFVKRGLVFVNGKKMADVAKRIDPETDTVEFNGQVIRPKKLVYYLLNKPLGCVSTTKDAHAKKLVTDLVPKNPLVWPVGRLDKNTEGLMILTNDGALTQKLTHPKYEMEKEYLVSVNTPLSYDEIKKIKAGIALEDGFINPDYWGELKGGFYKIILHSGKKRIIRRIIEKVGHRVIKLKRVRIDSLALDHLRPGCWRSLTNSEIASLLKN